MSFNVSLSAVTMIRNIKFVLVITCLGGQFVINCPSEARAISKFSKITRVIYPKNCPNETCDYCLITPDQQTLSIEIISFNSG